MKRLTDDAVSPVVGVILMLVVTIIIAAVVSGFAGGLMSSQEKAPQLTMQVSIKNTGTWVGSHFEAQVLGVDEPVPTKDLKLVTSYKATYANGTEFRKTTECIPGTENTYYPYSPDWGVLYLENAVAPMGYGLGEGNVNAFVPNEFAQQFGNYSLKAGVSMCAYPCGGKPLIAAGKDGIAPENDWGYGVAGNPYKYAYTAEFDAETNEEDCDEIQAVLGKEWFYLKGGDTVNVKFIHTPSGKVLWEKDVAVEGDL
jgi:FlaG/FlaF family flagellin (archaellin)